MALPELDSWWPEPERETGFFADPYEAAQRLKERLHGVPANRQLTLLERMAPRLLQQRHRYGVVLFLLDGITSRRGLEVIARHLLPLPERQSADEEAHLADLVRILAAADDERLLPCVEAYLLEREIAPAWPTVPWALWPHRESLFGVAWARYFAEVPPHAWFDAAVLRAFLAEPAAIRAVESHLSRRDGTRWLALRGALADQIEGARWLTAEQRAELDRALA